MRNRSLISTLIVVALVIIFIKPLLWLAFILLGLALIFFLLTIVKSKDIGDKIKENPQEYFNTNNVSHDVNVIDAEYKEREVKEKVNND